MNIADRRRNRSKHIIETFCVNLRRQKLKEHCNRLRKCKMTPLNYLLISIYAIKRTRSAMYAIS